MIWLTIPEIIMVHPDAFDVGEEGVPFEFVAEVFDPQEEEENRFWSVSTREPTNKTSSKYVRLSQIMQELQPAKQPLIQETIMWEFPRYQ